MNITFTCAFNGNIVTSEGLPCHHSMAFPEVVDGENSFQTWQMAVMYTE